jgi:hypothetical protein
MLTGDALLAKVKELYGEVDLSQFVDKQVRVTFRNGFKVEGKIIFNLNYPTSPYLFSYFADDMHYGRYYDKNGTHTPTEQLNIIKIEEIKPMNKYEQLENQVAEMQKEIDRLKREEKNYPKLKPVEIIRTVTYTPEEYFMYCEENGEEPSEEGYVKYYSEPEVLEDCFMFKGHSTQEIKVVEN